MHATEPRALEPGLADDALVARWKEGEERAFELLYERYAGRVTGYAQRMLGRREDAEEICIETFTVILEGRWRNTGSFRAWLFTVAHRRCLERLRRRTLTDRVLSMFRAQPEAQPASPEGKLLLSEQGAHLEKAIASLPREHRATLLLACAQELSAREVGEVLGLTDQQVRSQLSYARRLLRERMEGA
jgi:RNA polymerase sigma-70 factor (ECF subfamily)